MLTLITPAATHPPTMKQLHECKVLEGSMKLIGFHPIIRVKNAMTKSHLLFTHSLKKIYRIKEDNSLKRQFKTFKRQRDNSMSSMA